MAKVFVQFTDSTQTKIQSAFGCAQDPVEYPNQGQVDDTDARYVAFINPLSVLANAQIAANIAIDEQAGATRRKYITDVAGQSETYLTKANDAAAYKAANYPSANIASYPMVQAEAKAISGATPTAAQYQSAADGILTQQAQWIQLAAAIEQKRRGGKIAVSTALTVADVQAAQLATITALQAL